MIWWLWALFITLALVLFWLGYYMKYDTLRIMSLILLFLMGMSFMVSGVDYVIGTSETISLNSSVQVYQYATYTNHTIGFYLAIVALFSLVYIFFERRAPKP